MSSDDMIRCPHCGKMHPKETIYCPENGMPIFQAEGDTAPVPIAPRRSNTLWIIAGGAIGVAALCIAAVVAIFMLRRSAASIPPTITPAVMIIIESTTQAVPTLAPSLTSPAVSDTPSPTATVQPTSGPWEACPGAAYLSRLRVGDLARVISDPPVANRVRSEPSVNGSIVGYIQPGEMVTVLEGPGCSSSWVWWRVRSSKTDLEGWTAEGDQSGYWLIPLPPES